MMYPDAQVIHIQPDIIHDPIYLKTLDTKLVIVVEAHAHVTVVHDYDAGSSHVDIYAHEHATINYCASFTGGATTAHHFNLYPRGRGAHITLNVLYSLTDDQQCIITTKQEHTVPGATTTVLLKGIMGGRAQAEYTGDITITGDAPQSNAVQHAATLMVSPQARSRSIPSLQVLNNDVRCKHGSAVGQLNQEQIFYAQSRGLEYHQAQAMLLHGFLAQATAQLPPTVVPTIIARLLSAIFTKERVHGRDT